MNARKALPFVLYALLVALPSGCGDDDDSGAGTGGSAAKGGASSKGGANGKGGAASGGQKATGAGGLVITDGGIANIGGATGTAGTGEGGDIGAAGMSGGVGTIGAGGSGHGGAASGSGGAAHGGTTGTAGTASGGTTTGNGGTGTGNGGTAPAGGAGASGEGGVGGAPGGGGEGGAAQALLMCAESCTVDNDCAKSGNLNGRICSPTTHRCIMHLCEVDSDCVPDASAWTIGTACTGDGACASGQSCIDVKGAGHCVAVPQSGSCGTGKAPIDWAHFGGGGNVSVCGDLSNKCFAGTCKVPCQPSDCTFPAACNPATGGCDACADDAYCTTAPTKPPHCNIATGRCECHSNTECTGVRNSNVCVNGRCGCSDASACTRKVGDNAVLVCE